MKTPSTMPGFSTSRRSAMRMALASMLAGKLGALPSIVAAEDTPDGTWNWGGNARHTGELPGPGLDFDKPLGELWRIPGDDFNQLAGYLNNIIYSADGRFYKSTNLMAREISSGEHLWSLNVSSLGSTAEDQDSEAFSTTLISIDNGIIFLLANLIDGPLFALDASTGELLWKFDFDGESENIGPPMIVDHVAYFGGDGIFAVDVHDQPSIRWKTEIQGSLLGTDGDLVYVKNHDTGAFHALNATNGAEFWRLTSADLGILYTFVGLFGEGLLGFFYHDDANQIQLTLVSRTGTVEWSVNASEYWQTAWRLGNTVVVVETTTGSSTDSRSVIGLSEKNGDPLWRFEFMDRWSHNGDPVICAHHAYIPAYDQHAGGQSIIVIVDYASGDLVGALETTMVPFFLGSGVMLARDENTDEIVAIGPGQAFLQVGGRATTLQETTVRGAPGDSAIERETLGQGAVVTVTGAGENANNVEWLPVTVTDSGAAGWLPANVLEGMDGAIRFSPIDISEFGELTVY